MHDEYECAARASGALHVAGIDEVGRGCLFGDVVAAAVVLPAGMTFDGLNDSKKISEKTRNRLFDEIMEKAIAVGVGIVDAKTIDRINIRQAARLAMKQAVEQLAVAPNHLLVDAETVDLPIAQTSIIKGDATSISIAAASVIAKVTRDRMCEQWEVEFPGYGIAGHKGYATKQHRTAILEQGVTPLHRRSFLTKIFAEMKPEQQSLF